MKPVFARTAFAAMLVIATAAHALEDKKNLIISLCGIHHPSDDRITWTCYKRPLGKTPQQLWGDAWIDVLRFNRLDRLHFPEVNSLKVPADLKALRNHSPMPLVYSPAEKEARYILVDQTEQFLGAYEFGRLVFSAPITVGDTGKRTPHGLFRISAFDRDHKSTEYKLPRSKEPYPMRHGLMFHTDANGIQYWIHGRDMPGYPGSHGCIGLYDEQMEENYLDDPGKPILKDAQRLFNWAISGRKDSGSYTEMRDGPTVEIRGAPPKVKFEQKKKKKTGEARISLLAAAAPDRRAQEMKGRKLTGFNYHIIKSAGIMPIKKVAPPREALLPQRQCRADTTVATRTGTRHERPHLLRCQHRMYCPRRLSDGPPVHEVQ